MGLAPKGVQYQGTVAILDGIPTPFVLLRSQGTADYELIGPCYLHGIMYREASPQLCAAGTKSEWTTLV
jgi:hypothetical protein